MLLAQRLLRCMRVRRTSLWTVRLRGRPAGSEYVYVWTGRGSTANTDPLISGTNGPTPTFDVPEEVDEDKTYGVPAEGLGRECDRCDGRGDGEGA